MEGVYPQGMARSCPTVKKIRSPWISIAAWTDGMTKNCGGHAVELTHLGGGGACLNYAEVRLLLSMPSVTVISPDLQLMGRQCQVSFRFRGVVSLDSLPSFFQALQVHEFVSPCFGS
jgi:hypothetical protein